MAALLALVAVVLAGLGAQPGASAQRARVVAPTLSPVSVRGSLFRAGERVVVVVQAGGPHRRAVTATARGTFLVRFPGVSVGRCEFFSIRATGNRGSYAFFRVIPECAQP